MQEAESSEDSPLKALPKAYEQSEVKKAEIVFRSACQPHISRWQVRRGGGAAFFAKKSDYINENISTESRRNERAKSQIYSMESTKKLKESSEIFGFASMGELLTQRTPQLDFVKSRNDDFRAIP